MPCQGLGQALPGPGPDIAMRFRLGFPVVVELHAASDFRDFSIKTGSGVQRPVALDRVRRRAPQAFLGRLNGDLHLMRGPRM